MTSVLNEDGAAGFRVAARAFVELIERRRQIPPTEWLAQVHASLPRLYAAALELHAVDPDTAHATGGKTSREGWQELYRDLGELLGRWNAYWKVFDPYDNEDHEPIWGSLADDLSDIYRDLCDGLAFEETHGAAYPNDVYWTWRFDFESHWAAHATGALRAISTALHSHYATVLPESFNVNAVQHRAS